MPEHAPTLSARDRGALRRSCALVIDDFCARNDISLAEPVAIVPAGAERLYRASDSKVREALTRYGFRPR